MHSTPISLSARNHTVSGNNFPETPLNPSNTPQADTSRDAPWLDPQAEGVYFVDANRRILYWNDGAFRVSGYHANDVVGRRCQDDILCHVDAEGSRLCYGGCPLAATLVDGLTREATVALRHKDGTRVPVMILVQPVRKHNGEIVGAIESFSDPSNQSEQARQRMQQMRQVAFNDPRTQLPNRRRMEISLQIELHDFQVHKVDFGIILFEANTELYTHALSHPHREDALRHLTRTLVASLRPTDPFGRWADDQFIAIIKNINRNNLDRIASRCIEALARSTVLTTDGPSAPLSLTAGTAIAQSDITTSELIQHAQDRIQQNKTTRPPALPS